MTRGPETCSIVSTAASGSPISKSFSRIADLGMTMTSRATSTGLTWLAFVVAVGCASTGTTQEGKLAPNAPVDRPVGIESGESPDDALAEWLKHIEPETKKARATYADAKARYLSGLPAGENFFVTHILRDEAGKFEQVFILVQEIEDGTITGKIASDILAVQGYRGGQTVQLREADIVDWTISKADGSEEGNFVGKYLDSVQGH